MGKCLLLAIWVCLGLAVTACGPSVMAVDNEQPRLDVAAPLLQGDHVIGQTFVAHYPNLSGVEVLLVVYPDQGPEADVPRRLTFRLRAGPDSSQDLAVVQVDTRGLTHNSPYRFSFPPIANSAGRRLYFSLEGTPSNRVTVWSNSLNAYGEGEMFVDGVPQPGDLQFKTLYAYDLGLALGDLWRGLLTEGWLLLPAVLIFVAPGYLVWAWLLRDEESGPVEVFALSAGLSLALTPLALLFSTVVGLRWSRPLVLAASVALALLTSWQLVRSRFRHLRGWNLPALTFAAIFLISLNLRYLHIRDLVVPPWVDSVHHALIVKLMAEQGVVPASYEPYLPMRPFFYHFGFHALTTAFLWLTGLSVERSLLLVGQVMNALTVPATYLLARRLTGRAWAGVAAAAVPGALSLMPAYYLTWGRYTHLAGLALLPAAATLACDVVDAQRGAHGGAPLSWRRVLAAGIALAGLLVTHYRVLAFFGGLLLAHVLIKTVSERAWWPGGAAWGRAGWVCLAGGLLASPWLLRLASALLPRGTWWGWVQGSPSFNAVPFDLLDVGTNRWLIAVGLVGLAWAARERHRVAAIVPLWCGFVILAANPNVIGLPNTWVLNNSALVISLFLPLAVFIGFGFEKLLSELRRKASGVGAEVIGLVAGGLLVLLSLMGAWKMIQVVNPVTVLATRDDMVAMTWIREHVPEDARFLINTRHWQGSTYVGSDGGYWLWLITGRETVLPPIAYVYGPPEYAQRVLADAVTVAKATSLDDEGVLELAYRDHLSYVYLGAKGGSLSVQALLEDPRAELVYSNGAVWVFALNLGQ